MTGTISRLPVNHLAILCSDVTYDFIIGVDYLHQHSLDVRISTQKLEKSCDTLPLMIDTLILDPWCAAVQKTATIPAFHEMIAPASLHSKPGKPPVFLCGLVEHRPEFVESSKSRRCTEVVTPMGQGATTNCQTHVDAANHSQEYSRILTLHVYLRKLTY